MTYMEIVDMEEDPTGPGSAGYDGAEKVAQPNRFRIEWHGFHYGYRVSIPNYEGGEVVTAEAYDALRGAAVALLDAMEMQEGREKQQLYISQPEAWHVWTNAKFHARAALALVDVSSTTDEGVK